jgi:hypothetical protein
MSTRYPTKTAEGFYYNLFWLDASEQTVAYQLLYREEKRNPDYADARFGKPGDKGYPFIHGKPKDAAKVLAIRAVLKQHFYAKLYPRVQRLLAWRIQQNRKLLASMTPEQAMAAFVNRKGSSCLHWWECLPSGISIQEAVNHTRVSVNHTEWASGCNTHTLYFSPQALKATA